MTETERMKTGLIYDCSCDEIMQKQTGYVQYMKEYMQESLWNVFTLLYAAEYYCVKRKDILKLFLKVVNYQLKYSHDE